MGAGARRPPQPAQAGDHRGELLLLCLLELEAGLPAAGQRAAQLGHRPPHRPCRGAAGAQAGGRHLRACRQPVAARLLQVLRLVLGGAERAADAAGGGPRAASPGDRAPRRYLLLHLPGHLLHRRPLSRRSRPAAAADRRDVLHLVLSAPGGRPDRARGELSAPAGAAAQPQPGVRGARRDADPVGRVQEGRGGQLARGAPRRQGVPRSHRLRHRRSDGGGLWLRRADLLRLQRLQRHCHRRRRAARLPLPAQLQSAVSRGDARRLLAALAHVAVVLAARLSLHPPGRQPAWADQDLHQPAADHGAGRHLARRGLEVRDLGRSARRHAGGGADALRSRPRRPPRRRAASAVAARACRPLHLPLRLPVLDLLPRRRRHPGLRAHRRSRQLVAARRAADAVSWSR